MGAGAVQEQRFLARTSPGWLVVRVADWRWMMIHGLIAEDMSADREVC